MQATIEVELTELVERDGSEFPSDAWFLNRTRLDIGSSAPRIGENSWKPRKPSKEDFREPADSITWNTRCWGVDGDDEQLALLEWSNN